MKNQQPEENLARLLHAVMGKAARPDLAARQATLKRLRSELRAQRPPGAQAQAKAQGPLQETNGASAIEPAADRDPWRKPEEQPRYRKERLMSRLPVRWGLGLTAATGVALVLIAIFPMPAAGGKAADVMARGARAAAKLTSIHLRGQVRTLPADNFSMIAPDGHFYPIELWKQFEPEVKWRIEKPGRVAVMDGQSTVMLMDRGTTAVKLPRPTTGAFDTEWLDSIANLSTAIANELKNARAQGWKLSLDEQNGPDGRPKSIVTIFAKSDVPDNDYCKNAFVEDADTRRVYRFDSQSELLEAVQLYLRRPSGEVQVFDLDRIDYNQPIDPRVWGLELPADVSWLKDPAMLPDNAKYALMTAKEAARVFFEACGRNDWEEAAKFLSSLNDSFKRFFGGLRLVTLGKPLTSRASASALVPYGVELRPQDFYLRVSNANSARRYVITGVYDERLKLAEDLTWTTPPAVLPNNDLYARMSPVEAVKRLFDAQLRQDWAELRNFAPDYVVDDYKALSVLLKQRRIDPHKLVPSHDSFEATWSPEQSAWLVKYRQSGLVQFNLAIRKDNPAGRWQVDGGIGRGYFAFPLRPD